MNTKPPVGAIPAFIDQKVSLHNAIADAKRIAAQYGENIYILESAVYADAEAEECHVVGSKEVCAMMFPNYKEYGGKLVGVVDPKGTVFLNQIEDVLSQQFNF